MILIQPFSLVSLVESVAGLGELSPVFNLTSFVIFNFRTSDCLQGLGLEKETRSTRSSISSRLNTRLTWCYCR